MICVAQNDRGIQRRRDELIDRERFDRAGGSDRHEHRRFDRPTWRVKNAGASAPERREQLERKAGCWELEAHGLRL